MGPQENKFKVDLAEIKGQHENWNIPCLIVAIWGSPPEADKL